MATVLPGAFPSPEESAVTAESGRREPACIELPDPVELALFEQISERERRYVVVKLFEYLVTKRFRPVGAKFDEDFRVEIAIAEGQDKPGSLFRGGEIHGMIDPDGARGKAAHRKDSARYLALFVSLNRRFPRRDHTLAYLIGSTVRPGQGRILRPPEEDLRPR